MKNVHENERGIVMQNQENQEKVYFTRQDIEIRYGVGRSTALKIMRSIRSFGQSVPAGMSSVSGALGFRKLLVSEVLRWEENCGRDG